MEVEKKLAELTELILNQAAVLLTIAIEDELPFEVACVLKPGLKTVWEGSPVEIISVDNVLLPYRNMEDCAGRKIKACMIIRMKYIEHEKQMRRASIGKDINRK